MMNLGYMEILILVGIGAALLFGIVFLAVKMGKK